MRSLYFLLMMIILSSVLQICTANTMRKKLRSMKMTRPVQENINISNYKIASTESPAPGGLMGKNKHIISGSLSTRGQFPFLVGIDIDGVSFCGGSLISTTHILTAGHCTDGCTQFDVYLGGKDLDVEENGRIKITTEMKIIHPKFNLKALMNDLSILTLGQQVKTSQFIQIARLPSRPSHINSQVRKSVTVAGWGRTSDAVQEVSSILFHAQLEVLPQSDCIDVYGSDSVFSTNICAGSENQQATCQGDSGGPLVVRETDGTFIQIGVVSYGPEAGCEMGNPVVFSRVSSYLPWIISTAGIVETTTVTPTTRKTIPPKTQSPKNQPPKKKPPKTKNDGNKGTKTRKA